MRASSKTLVLTSAIVIPDAFSLAISSGHGLTTFTSIRTSVSFQYGASDAGQDLSGLVRMIHAAYEVLSDNERRRSYDAQLAEEAARADDELKSTLDDQSAVVRRRVQDVPAPLSAAFTALAA